MREEEGMEAMSMRGRHGELAGRVTAHDTGIHLAGHFGVGACFISTCYLLTACTKQHKMKQVSEPPLSTWESQKLLAPDFCLT